MPAGLIGTALLLATFRQLDLGPLAALAAFGTLALVLFPFGAAVTGRFTEGLPPGERWTLAAVVGYPAAAFLYQLLSWAGVSALFLLVWLAAVVIARRTWRQAVERAASPARPLPWLVAIVPCLLLLSTRGGAPLRPHGDGAMVYRHSVDHSAHLAFYWEMARDFPPRQVPTAAGLPFPSYHTLSFVPGVWLVRHAGVNVTTVYHAVSPLLRLTLLLGAVYLTVRWRTGSERLALAALPSVLVLSPWIETLLAERVLSLPSAFFTFQRNESNGGGVVAWSAVAALLALYQRHRAPASLWVASCLVGLAAGFKAQMFVVFAPAFGLVLLWFLLRTRAREWWVALLLAAVAFGVTFAAAQGAGPLGELSYTPGLLARRYVYPTLARDPWVWVHRDLLRLLVNLPAGVDVAASALAVWRLAGFSVLAPLVVFERLRRFVSAGPLDLVFAGAFVLAVPLGVGFSAMGMDREATPLEFIQGAQALTFCAAVLNVIGLSALIDRAGADGPRITFTLVLVASLLVGPMLWLTPPTLPPREAIVLSADELCALRFLRDETPFEAVTIGWRDEPTEDGGRPKRLNHHAVLAGLGGRRSVLEYYGPEVDPATNREEAVRQLFTTTSPVEAHSILDRFGVDYVVEFASRRLLFRSPRLEPVYASGRIRIQRVRRTRDSPPERAPLRAWADRNDLVCDGPDGRFE